MHLLKSLLVGASLAFILLLPTIARAQIPSDPKCVDSPTPPKSIASTHTMPPWPREAVTKNEGGTTVLGVTIGPDGRATDVSIQKSSGSTILDETVRAWVKSTFRWEPATLNCKPVEAGTLLNAVWINPDHQPEYQVEDAIPTSWSGEAAASHQDGKSFRIPCTVNDIKATIRLSDPRSGPDVTPILAIALANLDGPGQLHGPETILFRLGAFGKDGALEILERKDGGRTQSYDISFPNKVSYGQDIPIELRWEIDGQMNIRADWKNSALGMSLPPQKLTFYVESGKGEISNIQASWQSSRSPQPQSCK